ncbi:hypothetical protein M404DRAFT_1000155 [Pisolithus tinctorius Marx 270]|uniref:Uncharacterized protein n=1 Tax=Pisolithus tinctorius Marx 270 TaxID=870435 RepID=A0A0C3NW77_PISTI|nr:hypothetical protein M404DRAFT_1000155 [Pisolithus tinctorius Marx 270]
MLHKRLEQTKVVDVAEEFDGKPLFLLSCSPQSPIILVSGASYVRRPLSTQAFAMLAGIAPAGGLGQSTHKWV